MLARTNPSHLESPYIEGSNNSTEAVIIAQDAISRAQLQLPVQDLTREEVNKMLDAIRLSSQTETLADLRQGSDPEVLAEIRRLGINFYQ